MKKLSLFALTLLVGALLTACSHGKQASSSDSKPRKSSSSLTSSKQPSSSSTPSTSSEQASSSSATTSSSSTLPESVPSSSISPSTTEDHRFDIIQGTWKNNLGYVIHIVNNEADGSPLTVMPDYPYAFLMEAKMQSGDPTSVVLVFTPAGQTIRDAALPDLSDQSRDRFLITNGGLLSEQTATEVYYKQ